MYILYIYTKEYKSIVNKSLVTDKTWCNQQKYEPPIRTDMMISSLYIENFSDKFDNFMYKIKKHKKNKSILKMIIRTIIIKLKVIFILILMNVYNS